MATAFEDEQSLAAIHLAETRALAARYSKPSAAALAQQVGPAVGLSELPTQLSRQICDTLRQANGLVWQNLLFFRDGEPPLPVRRRLSKEPLINVVIWLPGQGMATVLRDSAARLAAYQHQGTAVLLADLRGLGETTDPAPFNDPKYYNQEYREALLALHIGRPLLAQRVADVATLVAYAAHRASDTFCYDIQAEGRAALPALQAALLLPRIGQVQVSGGPPSFHYFLENPAAKDAYAEVLPGVLRTYDVPDLRRALGVRLLP